MTDQRPVLLRRHVTKSEMRNVDLEKHVPTIVAKMVAKRRALSLASYYRCKAAKAEAAA